MALNSNGTHCARPGGVSDDSGVLGLDQHLVEVDGAALVAVDL